MWPHNQCNFKNSWSYKICIQPVSWSSSASGPAAVVNNNKPWFAQECLWFCPCTFKLLLFLQRQIHEIIFPLSFSFKGEQCLVKNALGTISIVEQLVQHKHDFVFTAGQGLGICCSGIQTAHRETRQREERPQSISQNSKTKSVSLCPCRTSVSRWG